MTGPIAGGSHAVPLSQSLSLSQLSLFTQLSPSRGVVEGDQGDPVGGRVHLRLSQLRAGRVGKGQDGNRHPGDEKSGNGLCRPPSPTGGPRGRRCWGGPHAEDAPVVPVGLAQNAPLGVGVSLDLHQGSPHRRGRWIRSRTRRAEFP